MKLNVIPFYCSIFLCTSSFAGMVHKNNFADNKIVIQKAILSGKVVDAVTNNPLAGATIYLHETKVGTIATADGSFSTPLIPYGKYLIEISFVGYKSILETITIGANNNKEFRLQLAVVENEAVTVTGVASAVRTKQTAQPVSIVKKSDFQKTASTNLIDALSRMVPGVTSLTTGASISKPIIRGLGYNRVITINDGIRQEGQQWGDEHGIEIDEASVQRVEVLKGPASLLYGSDGMGGVINIITNNPVEQGRIIGNINAGFLDNNSLISTNANIAGHLKNGFNWNIYGSVKSAKDYQNKYDGRVLNSRFNERNFGGYIGINKSWGYSHLLVSNFNQNLGLIEGERDSATGKFLLFTGTSVEKIATNEELNSRSLQTPSQVINHFKIASDNSISLGNGRLNINIGYQQNKRKEFGDPFATTTPGLYFNLQTVNYNVQYHFAERAGWKTAIGANGMFQQNKNLGEEVLIPEYNQFDAGVFFYTRKTFNNKITLSGGLRGDHRNLQTNAFKEASGVTKFTQLNKTFGNFSGSVGIAYEASEAVTIRANIARGYRAPAVSELASNGAHEGTNRYEYGDPNLKTENSLQFDAGVEVNTQHVSIMFNAFYNDINNYIFYSKLSNKLGGDSLVNVNGEDLMAFKFKQSSASLYGFEAKIDLHPHPLDWLHFANTFSMVTGKFNESFEGVNHLPFIPPARLLTELRGDIKKCGAFKNLYIKGELDFVFVQKRVFTAYDTETATPAYTLLNFGAGADITQKGKIIFSLYLSMNNITDVAYQNHLSRLKYTAENNVTGRNGVFNMGRNFSVKINVPFGFKVK